MAENVDIFPPIDLIFIIFQENKSQDFMKTKFIQ